MIDAYVWTTPNGFKALATLEELGLPYTTHWVDIGKGGQDTPAFRAVNPNGKIPALVDGEITLFESGAVAVYLAEKAGKLLPAWGPARYSVLSWTFFNIGGPGPMLGQLGYFSKRAPEKIPAAIQRFADESERLFGVLDKRLGEVEYLGGDFSIADTVNYPWLQAARSFLGIDLAKHANLTRWLDKVGARPAVAKAMAMKPTT